MQNPFEPMESHADEKTAVGTAAGEAQRNGHEDNNSFDPTVTYIPNCLEPGNVHHVSLQSILQAIRKGKYKDVVTNGRSLKKDKTSYSDFKSRMVPAFAGHGVFSYVDNDHLEKHNGLACLDIDGLADKDKTKDTLELNPYVYLMFDSYGGDGLAVFCRTPEVTNADEFEAYHRSLRDYFFHEYGIKADEGAKSLKNLRLVSHDPGLYFNPNARVWHDLPELRPKRKTTPKAVNNHYEDILPLVAKLGHNGFTDDQIRERLAGISIAPDSCLNDPAEVEKLITNIRSHYTEGKEGVGHDSVQYDGFWTNDHKKPAIQLSLGLLGECLYLMGWRVLDGEYVVVSNGVIHKKNNAEFYDFIIKLVSYKAVSFKLKDYTFTVDRTTLKTKAQKEIHGNLKILALSAFDFVIQRDTATEAFFHFRNKSMRITKDEISLFDRNEGNSVIWAEQVLPHDILEDDSFRPVFAEFLMNISGPENYKSFMSAIGRGLHNYNGSDGMRVPWFCDEDYRAGESNGRTGKSLVLKAMGKCRNMDLIHGKDFTPDNRFKFQNVGSDTQIMGIDDVKENSDFRAFYNITSEGLEYERKNQTKVKLSIHETPQLIVTSNHPPQIEQGASTTGRLFILPVKNFYQPYTDEGGVKAYHGHTFFDDWDPTEWNRFYWFMAVCAKHYLQNGYLFADQSQIRKNRLKEILVKKVGKDTADDLAEYMYSLPNEFTLDQVMMDFDADVHDKKAVSVYSACLKTYFEIEKKPFEKVRERTPDGRKWKWKML